MEEFLDNAMLTLIEGLYGEINDMFSLFISNAQVLASIFMLLYFGMESYKLMVGDKQLEIMAILRPFALGLTIIFWTQFVSVLRTPTSMLTATSKEYYFEQIKKVEEVFEERNQLIDSVTVLLNERAQEAQEAQDKASEGPWYKFGISMEGIGNKIRSMYIYVTGMIRQFFFRLFEWATIILWQFCVFIVFLFQLVFSCLLITLGPISFALSVLPAFRDSYIQWISRFISVSLYGTIAYLALSICLRIQLYGMKQEVTVLKQVLASEPKLVVFASFSQGGTGLFIITMLLGSVVMLTVPTMSTWVVSTSGVGSAVSGVSRGLSKAIKSVL